MCFSEFFNYKAPSKLPTYMKMPTSEDYQGILELQTTLNIQIFVFFAL